MQLILSHHLSLTFCWAFLLAQQVNRRNTPFHAWITLLTCSFDTRNDNIYMTGFYKSCIGMEFRSFCLKSDTLCCLMFLRIFFPFVSLCLRIWCGRRRSSFSSLWLKLHESPVEHCLCAFHSKHSPTFLSKWAFFPCWLLVTDPRSTTSFRTLKFRVLIIWSMWSFYNRLQS